MSNDQQAENTGPGVDDNQHRPGRKKQKVRIKYRQRIKITKRPKGYKLKRFWKKNGRTLLASVILISLLLVTFIMAARLAKQQVELNKMEKDSNMTIPE